MNQSFKKLLIFVSLIAVPIIILWSFKEVIFRGGKNLPELAIVSDTPIQDFSFINQDRDTITNQDYEGKIYIANFIFTRCPAICGEMTRNISIKLQRELAQYDNVYFLSHTVDPTYDSPEILKKYADRYKNEAGADLSKWNFVTGDKEEIYNHARLSYFAATEDDGGDPKHAGFIHSQQLFLIDTKGRIRSGFRMDNNPFIAYDGLDAQELKFLVRDVGVLVSETKRKARDYEK